MVTAWRRKFMKCKDWNKSESDSWLIYQSGSRGQGGAGEQVNDWEEWDPLGAFPFISEVSSSNVVSVTLLSFFSVHFWNSYSIAFWYLLVNPTSTVAKQQVFLQNLNASTLPWLWVLRGPSFLCFWAGFVFLDCTHRVRWNGVPSHSVLRSIPISFSANLLTHLQLFCGRKTISVCRQWACFLHLWPWPWCWAYPWVQLSCRIHFLVHRDFLGFLRVSPQLHHHRLWCGFGCLRLSWFWWMSDLA